MELPNIDVNIDNDKQILSFSSSAAIFIVTSWMVQLLCRFCYDTASYEFFYSYLGY